MSDRDSAGRKVRNQKLRQDICRHFGNRVFGIPVDKGQNTPHQKYRNRETRRSVEERFRHLAFRDPGSRGDRNLES
jgi:hypothetical protein